MTNNFSYWNNVEIAIIISAIDDSRGTEVNINYLRKLLPHRSESAIRNKVREFADKMQYFKLGTTIKPFNADSFDNFKSRILNPKKRDFIKGLLFRFNIFKESTSKLITDNFWRFNEGGV